MRIHLRVARPVRDLERSAAMYERGLGLARLGAFAGHGGFDGVLLGRPGLDYHLEFTYCHHRPVTPAPSDEDLLVLYISDAQAWEQQCRSLIDSGFVEVEPHNPYWAVSGRTFRDVDGYRTVLQCGPSPVARIREPA